ncbi:transmembrane channel-like protein 5 isoform X1 [Anguilla anguilla]|uniref:transmembrane channel-like protein 5 isoform X1 n=2 Tax=Anguilla anguilla TaxID=7936 RepID=UPI0015A88FA7|nr:transmembrane channel-like protein 5 isoform X1 [Anguilla anguilla]XP_035258704.1 transmembrane channel-like protein 5 isoform X1 [Anguilla anguilla]XP_035258705.1 transmembrane channel-like protein 5 isoform X1 [Anguilla anguilla]XP_035258706.1 transmembrane channel-like protein 5 isoform X1 [Anguilla anguilla]
MSYYNREGLFNPAYHDSETLEIDRSPSRRSHHYNPYDRDSEPWQRGLTDWTPPEALPRYNEQGRYLGDSGEGNWRPTDHMAMGLVPHPNGSLRWQHNQGSVNAGYQADSAVDYITPPLEEQPPWAPHMGETLRQRGTRKMSLFPGGGVALGRLGITEEDVREEIQSGEQELVKELVAMSSRDQIQAMRVLQMSLQDKRHIRRQVLACKSSKRGLKLTCLTDCTEQVSRSFRRFGASMVSAKQAMTLWHGTIKEIGGKFGTSVLSYFLFLKWLLMFNVFSFVVNFGFITVPQLVQLPNRTDQINFRGLELLTGAGYFNQTVLYYGGYSNETIGDPPAYDMQLAYFFTIAAYLVLCGLSLIYSMARSFQKNFVLSASGNAWCLLCSWDFSITNVKAIRQRQNNLRVQLKESLSEKNQGFHMTMSEKLKQFGIHLGTWFISTGLAAASCAAIYFLCLGYLDSIKDSQDSSLLTEASTLLLPFVVSLINLVIPLLYSLLSKIEKYSNPRTQIYVIILRNVFLKMGILGILCYYWMKILSNRITCWESIVGQDLYRLVIIDFIFLMLETFFGEFLHNIIGTKCLPSLGVPEFDIARNVLNLIYAQTLAWIGIYFSPLLPVLQMIKLFIMFYLKKVSLYQNCQPPRRYGRAAQMQTIFIALLFIPSFVGAVSMVAYTVWSLKPSAHCGPFQGLDTTFEAVVLWMERVNILNLPESMWAVWIFHNVIKSELFFYLISLIILVLIYFFWQITQGRKLLINLLREQIINEGKDKAFLLEKLQKLQKTMPTMASSQPAYTQMPQTYARIQEIEPDYEQDFQGLPGIPHPEEGSGPTGPPITSALIQAMLARKQAEEDEEEGY